MKYYDGRKKLNGVCKQTYLKMTDHIIDIFLVYFRIDILYTLEMS